MLRFGDDGFSALWLFLESVLKNTNKRNVTAVKHNCYRLKYITTYIDWSESGKWTRCRDAGWITDKLHHRRRPYHWRHRDVISQPAVSHCGCGLSHLVTAGGKRRYITRYQSRAALGASMTICTVQTLTILTVMLQCQSYVHIKGHIPLF